MGKKVHDDVLDGAFNILNDATTLLVCSSEPADRAAALAAALADVAIDGTDFTIANGDVSGRKCTIAAQTGVPVDTSGTATHLALIDGSRLLYVTTVTSQALVAGNTVNTPAWDVEIADPT